MTLSQKKNVELFLVGSSLPVVFITMIYVGSAYRRSGRPAGIPYELFPIVIPLFYGIFSIVNYHAIKVNINYALLVGATMGLLFSFMGRFGLSLPQKIFGFTTETEGRVHLFAIMLYALIFRFVLTPIQKYVFQ